MKNILEYQWLLLPVVVFLSFFIRYTAIAGGMYWVFYVWKKDKFYKRKNQLPFPDKGQVRYEIKWSLYSSIVMGFIGTSVYYAYKHGYTRVYENISDMGWGYYIFSIFFMMFIHDIYFYFMHRLLHKKFMWKIHSVHHYCKNPTPWSSFCMHPVEMLMVGGIVAPMLFVIPAHMSAFFIFALVIMVNTIYGHSGFELFKSGFTKHKYLKWLNTETFHNMHHSKIAYNFGLYTNLWDRLFKTVHSKYDRYYEEVVNRLPGGNERQREELKTDKKIEVKEEQLS